MAEILVSHFCDYCPPLLIGGHFCLNTRDRTRPRRWAGGPHSGSRHAKKRKARFPVNHQARQKLT
jgi:hypothetical protein